MANALFGEEFSTLFSEEVVSIENSVSVEDDFLYSNDGNILDQAMNYDSMTDKIPFSHFLCLCLLIAFLSFSLNLIILLYYAMSKEATRFYILSLVIIDWFIIVMLLLPYSILMYACESDLLNYIYAQIKHNQNFECLLT